MKFTKEELELLGVALAALMENTLGFKEVTEQALGWAKASKLPEDMKRYENALAKCVEQQDAVAKLQVKLINHRLKGDGQANLKRIRELTKGARR